RGAVRRGHGAAVVGVRPGDVRTALPRLSRLAGNLPDRMVRRIDRDADAGRVPDPDAAPRLARPAEPGAHRLDARRLGPGPGRPVLTAWPLVPVRRTAAADGGRAGGRRAGLPGLRRAAEATRDVEDRRRSPHASHPNRPVTADPGSNPAAPPPGAIDRPAPRPIGMAA